MDHDSDILTKRMTLPELADRLGYSTSYMRDLRDRDARFPSADGQGRYRLTAVLALLDVREAERQTDEQFDQERREWAREGLARIEREGDDTGGITRQWAEEVMDGQHDGQRQEWIDERLSDLARYSGVPLARR
jgi:hypothetical protein